MNEYGICVNEMEAKGREAGWMSSTLRALEGFSCTLFLYMLSHIPAYTLDSFSRKRLYILHALLQRNRVYLYTKLSCRIEVHNLQSFHIPLTLSL